jgi:putative transposase
VDENQVICVENLAVKNMVKNHNLAKSISDMGWGQFCTMLKYKAEWAGKTYIEVDRFFPSSKTCNHCLHQVKEMPLDVRSWQCPNCKTIHDRDVNAAQNIRDEGLRLLAVGHTVSATKWTNDDLQMALMANYDDWQLIEEQEKFLAIG